MKRLHKLILSALLCAPSAHAGDVCQASADLHYELALLLEESGEAPWPSYADGEYEDAYARCVEGLTVTDAVLDGWYDVPPQWPAVMR